MSSANEHLPCPPKPRVSPLDFRNTDLVSRLLAATPPYLYNMSLLPNTYFFSEMLRSFVQAKTDHSTRTLPGTLQSRRSRKRHWASTSTDPFQKVSPKPESTNDWLLKTSYVPEHKLVESPLELTTEKLSHSDTDKIADNDNKSSKVTMNFNSNLSERKMDMPSHDQLNSIFPVHNNQDSSSGLILPPPPPMWYPPLYPTAPYGIDPLHFFIDLRVSGHIYDRKNQRETETDTKLNRESSEVSEQQVPKDVFKQSRHASAFSVPVPHLRNGPMNLSNSELEHGAQESKKFDVKSMGFDKSSNKTGTTYIMSNIENIYKNVSDWQQNVKREESPSENSNETEEERQKRVKDLRALIGLELVVDYMNHAKPKVRRTTDESSSTDLESVGSPALEVVALPDNET